MSRKSSSRPNGLVEASIDFRNATSALRSSRSANRSRPPVPALRWVTFSITCSRVSAEPLWKKGPRAKAVGHEQRHVIECGAPGGVGGIEGRDDRIGCGPVGQGDESQASGDISDVELEILQLIEDRRVVEDLGVARVVRVERAIERQCPPRPGCEYPHHAIGESEWMARSARAPAFT